MSTYTVLRHQHSSLQFSDSPKQQEADVAKLFEQGQHYPIKTGTETGRDTELFDLVQFYTKKFDHLLCARQGNWVAVDRGIIEKRTARRGHIFVVDNSQLTGKQRDREFPWIQFTHSKPGVGRIAVAGFHYSTKGRHPSDPNHDTNKKYAKEIEEWMKGMSIGTNISLGAGDFNMVDSMKKQDWAFGGGFTSMADELKTYFNTGHGPIDGFVSYDADHRVKAKKLVVLDDDKLHLHTDHFVARGAWSIRHLKEN
jgi:hypothetical protein